MRKFRKKVFKYYTPWAALGVISLGLMISSTFINAKHHALLYNLLEVPGLFFWIISLWCMLHVQHLRARAQHRRNMAHLSKMLQLLQQAPSQQGQVTRPSLGPTAQMYFAKAAAQRLNGYSPQPAIHKLNAPGRKK